MQVQRELEHYRSDALYFEEHRAELLRHHGEQWIAIYNRHVVNIAKEMHDLLRKYEQV